MLVEIVCDKFKQNKTTFKPGLNVVLGDDNASNSIGKSTFLLAVDFAFGGESYAQNVDILSHIGQHSICFCFKFKNAISYFKRDTTNAATVYKCNAKYISESSLSIKEYRAWLMQQYCICINGLSWRQLVGLYMRIYGKANTKETEPLHNGAGKQSDAVQLLLKIFDVFEKCSEQAQQKKKTAERYNTFRKAQTYKIIEPVTNLSEYNKLEEGISGLKAECDNLADVIQSDLSDVTTEQLYAIAHLKKNLSEIQRVKAKRQIRLKMLNDNLSSIDAERKVDFASINRFFPNANLQELEMINEFHCHLITILSKDIKKEIKIETNEIASCEEVEKGVIESIKRVIGSDSSKCLSLDRYVQLQKEMQLLVNGKGLYQTGKRFKEEMDEANALYETMLKDSLTEVQNKLNEEINRRNDIVFDGKVKSPEIALFTNRYTYTCNDDSGTGSNYRNLILFDLSVLSLTLLPILVHDTILFKNIAVDVTARILPQYMGFESKQVFIAFDNMVNYSVDAKKILNENCVLSLAPHGNELFGISWNKKSQ